MPGVPVWMERRHLRKAVDRPAKIYLAGDEGVVCRIRDISKGGAKIRIAWDGMAPDSFEREDSFTHVRREVWVVWRETSYVGVRFADEGPWLSKPRAFGPPTRLIFMCFSACTSMSRNCEMTRVRTAATWAQEIRCPVRGFDASAREDLA